MRLFKSSFLITSLQIIHFVVQFSAFIISLTPVFDFISENKYKKVQLFHSSFAAPCRTWKVIEPRLSRSSITIFSAKARQRTLYSSESLNFLVKTLINKTISSTVDPQNNGHKIHTLLIIPVVKENLFILNYDENTRKFPKVLKNEEQKLTRNFKFLVS